jgi:alpha-glucosidase (family GH31 glycosyl hydrolase)
MPPYWSLGFQLCRYGYNKLSNLKAAVDRTKQYNIPHVSIDRISGWDNQGWDSLEYAGYGTTIDTPADKIKERN